MSTRKKSKAVKFLEGVRGGKLTFGRLLRSIRMCEEISQVDFSLHLGISKQYLCDIEKGRRCVSPKAVAEFAEILGYSAEQFVQLSLQDMLDRDGIHFTVQIEAA